MVFNPPILKEGEWGEEPTTIRVAPQRSADAYVAQATRAIAWVGIWVIIWLWQRLMCYFDLPPHCDLPMEAQEVLTDLLVLCAFGLTQAWFVEILEERRFRHLFMQPWWPIVIVGIGLAVSALETTDWFQDLRFKSNDDWETGQITFSCVLAIITVLIVVWHFAEAWRVLPGAYYVSGQVNINVIIVENLHRIYNVSRGIIFTYILLYAAFAIDRNQGVELHHVLLAYLLSLFAQFKNPLSILWLALCTGVFLQGIGAYRLRFLCNTMGNDGNGYTGNSED